MYDDRKLYTLTIYIKFIMTNEYFYDYFYDDMTEIIMIKSKHSEV